MVVPKLRKVCQKVKMTHEVEEKDKRRKRNRKRRRKEGEGEEGEGKEGYDLKSIPL